VDRWPEFERRFADLVGPALPDDWPALLIDLALPLARSTIRSPRPGPARAIRSTIPTAGRRLGLTVSRSGLSPWPHPARPATRPRRPRRDRLRTRRPGRRHGRR
jgi:hypothetical protein